MDELLLELGKLSPIILLLIVAIRYFLQREKKLEDRIEELQKELRENDKENVALLYKVTAFLKKITDEKV